MTLSSRSFGPTTTVTKPSFYDTFWENLEDYDRLRNCSRREAWRISYYQLIKPWLYIHSFDDLSPGVAKLVADRLILGIYLVMTFFLTRLKACLLLR